MKKGDLRIIPIDIFVSDVIVSINQTDDQLYEFLCNRFSRDQFDLAWDDWKSDARTVTHVDGFVIIRFRSKIKNDPDHIGLVAHESFHAACSILENVGIKHTRDTDEVYAYLIQLIVREILKKPQS